MITPANLLIPFALDATGQMVSPFAATPGEAYFCPGCLPDSVPIIHVRGSHGVRNGTSYTIRPHFSHLSDKRNLSCGLTNPETRAHLLAKFHLSELAAEGTTVHLWRFCRTCRWERFRTPLPLKGASVALEWSIGRRRADARVGLPSGLELLVEVKATHAVDATKAAEMNKLGTWVELTASDMLDGIHWEILQGNWDFGPCPECAARERKQATKVGARLLARPPGLDVAQERPTLQFRAISQRWVGMR